MEGIKELLQWIGGGVALVIVLSFLGVDVDKIFNSMFGGNSTNSGQNVEFVSGNISIISDFCTFNNDVKDRCWIQEGTFQVQNISSKTHQHVLVQVDYYTCPDSDTSDLSKCKPVARSNFICRDLILQPSSQAGCSTKVYSRGRKPFSDSWAWTASALTDSDA